MSRVSLRNVAILVMLGVAGFHLGAVTMAALPTNNYSSKVQPSTRYLDPFFTQNWRLFAPHPISSDRSVLFEGSYELPDGSLAVTDPIDWTDVELDLVRHQLVGGRAGYISNKLYSPLRSRRAALSSTQRMVADGTDQRTPPSVDHLRRALLEKGDFPQRVEAFLRYDTAVTQLATDVLQGRWPDRTFTAVRVVTRNHGVVPFEARRGSDAERGAARPAATEQRGGWRVPLAGDARELAVVTDFDLRHR